jgi:hypothetical protein
LNTPQPGWYQTADGAYERYFDGTEWTQQVRPVSPPQAPVEPPAQAVNPFVQQTASAKPAGSSADKPVKRGKKALVVGGVAIAAILGLGGAGAVAAYQFGVFGAPGAQPTEVLPSTSIAYVSVDMNPSADQKIAAYNLSKKFDKLGVKSQDSLKDDLLRKAFESDDSIDYDKDVKPWLGDRGAVAAVPDASSKDGVAVVVAVEVTDKKKAEADLAQSKKESDDPKSFNYAVVDDYAIVASTKSALDATVNAKSHLADNKQFVDDTTHLNKDRVVTAWVDLDKSADAIAKYRTANGKPTENKSGLTGTAAAAVHLEGDLVEVGGYVTGSGIATGSKVDLIDEIPPGADIAVELTGLDKSLALAFNQAGAQASVLSTIIPGINLPTDIPTLVGSDTAIGINVEKGKQIPDARFSAKTADPSASVAKVNGALASSGFGPLARVAVKGDHYTIETGGPGATSILTNPKFNKVVPNAKDTSAFAFFDISNLLAAYGNEETKDFEAIDAIGVSGQSDGKTGTFTVRVAFK